MGLVVGWAMVFAPLTSALAMGLIAYPLYRRRPGGMAAFQRSGLWWWFGTLAVLVALGASAYPELFRWSAPSQSADVSIAGFLLWAAVGVVGALVVEIADDRIFKRDDRAVNQAFLDVLPKAARSPGGLRVAVVGMAALEEAAFRALLLGFVIGPIGVEPWVAAALCAIVFGVSHWYYGPRQIVLKTFGGAMFCIAALGAGWVAALVAHVVFNLVITELSTRHAVTDPTADR